MRRLIASTFASLDGIMQAPGGPEEDPTGGFALGGWMFNYQDKTMDISVAGFDGKDRELVLGRRTYEMFEAYWPYQRDDNPIARTLNAATKYVASRTLTTLHWNNSALLHGDVVSAIITLKSQPGPDLQIPAPRGAGFRVCRKAALQLHCNTEVLHDNNLDQQARLAYASTITSPSTGDRQRRRSYGRPGGWNHHPAAGRCVPDRDLFRPTRSRV